MMRTRLARFSTEFDAIVRPLLDPLHGAVRALEEASTSTGERKLLPDLHELHHQLEILADKVADQQAFILIFGPLKSGKSTLMNALSAAYVSEVTSLPAYPCMVYLSHSHKKSFKVTRYDGEAEQISDTTALRMHIQRAHVELAARIRTVESEGEEFDPAVHLPQAIRKIDVKIPAGELAQSGAVLVDTPGLYSRMKFGYDRMTREFRNAAACAMFVVKPDNLFLEQVFAEFTELLELFSRIFLVVNVDTTKMDLDSDGKLVPSLEQSDPLRLIEAFENLAMSAPLKQAAEEGRLRIYPVDLLRAASWRLRHGKDDAEPAAEEDGADAEAPEAYRGQASFDAFLGDLTEFLNSTDYLNAFLHDSLRRASTLLTELAEVCDRQSVKDLFVKLADLERVREEEERRRAALARLAEHDWVDSLGELRERVSTQLTERARQAEERTGVRLDAALDGWFTNDVSLHGLLNDELVPVLREHRADLAGFARDVLAREALDETGGLVLSQELRGDLYLTGIGLQDMARAAAKGLAARKDAGAAAPFSADDVPVRKRFIDWLLFRSRASVRRRVLGPSDAPAHRIRQADKEARLGQAAREAMGQKLDQHLAAFYREAGDSVQRRALEAYERGISEPLLARITEQAETVGAAIETLDARIAELRLVQERVRALELGATDALKAIGGLSQRTVGSEPDVWLQPAPHGEQRLSLLMDDDLEPIVDEVEETVPGTPPDDSAP